MSGTPVLLSEEYVQNCFHSYLKSALTQAKAERLLDTEVLSSAEGDLMITGEIIRYDTSPKKKKKLMVGFLFFYLSRSRIMLILRRTQMYH